MMKIIALLAFAGVATALPSTEAIVPEWVSSDGVASSLVQVSAFDEASATVQSMITSGKDEGACADLAAATMKEVSDSVDGQQKMLDSLDTGADCPNKGQGAVDAAQSALDQANKDKEDADAAAATAASADVNFGPKPLSGLTPGNCGAFFSDPAYTSAKAAEERARARVCVCVCVCTVVRHLPDSAMGNGNFKHDPGPDGESGEGDSTIVQFCFIYLIVAAVLYYEKFIGAKRRLEEAENNKNVEGDGMAAKVEAAVEAAKAAAQEKGETLEGFAIDKVRADEEDKFTQEKWTEPADQWQLSESNRQLFVKIFSFGLVDPAGESGVSKAYWFASGLNFYKLALVVSVFWVIWIFLLALSLMGTGFKLLGGRDSAKMFDVVDNPISGVMIGILITVLVQSSSTSTSIIISLVGSDELSVSNAVPMVMGANIGTSVTNTIVAMGHFNSKTELRRGFAAATVHDLFNLLSVAIILPLNWATTFLEEMTKEMSKDKDACTETNEGDCDSQDFLKPYMKPYTDGVASYDKKVALYIAEGYCDGQCAGVPEVDGVDTMEYVTSLVCDTSSGSANCGGIHSDYEGSWMKSSTKLKEKRAPLYVKTNAAGDAADYLLSCPTGDELACDAASSLPLQGALAGNTVYEVCSSFKTGLCDKRLLKGGLMRDDWDMSDDGAGVLLTIMSIACLCCCLFLVVYSLQIIIKGFAARILKKTLGLNGYLNLLVGLFITLMVQSSSITTSTLTPLCAVGIISLEEMFPLTLGANIGTTVTGLLAASVATSNAQAALQVALCHLFFNIFGILIWYPIPRVREIPLNGARWLGTQTAKYGVIFPFIYTGVVFFAIPAICYGIAVAATGE